MMGGTPLKRRGISCFFWRLASTAEVRVQESAFLFNCVPRAAPLTPLGPVHPIKWAPSRQKWTPSRQPRLVRRLSP